MTPIFLGDWQDVEDVKADFEIGDEVLHGANILLAGYWYEDYCGEAFVLYEKEGELFEVNGSHCSCYELEGQWDPELTTIEALEHRLDHGREREQYAEKLREILNNLKSGENK
jgi:hypothetical protein